MKADEVPLTTRHWLVIAGLTGGGTLLWLGVPNSIGDLISAGIYGFFVWLFVGIVVQMHR